MVRPIEKGQTKIELISGISIYQSKTDRINN